MKPQKRTLQSDLHLLLEKSQSHSSLSLEEIAKILSGKSLPLALIFLSLPFCQPLQIPGLSIPFGLVIAFISLRIAFGKRVWWPKRVLSKTISSTKVQKIVRKSLYLISKMQRFIHPRLQYLCCRGAALIVNGLLLFFLGILLSLPLPIPLTNLITGWSIFFISLGLLEDDGLFVLIGYLFFLLTAFIFVGILFSIQFASI